MYYARCANSKCLFHKLFQFSVTFETIQNVLVIFYLTSSNSVQQTQTLVSSKIPAVRTL